MAIPAASARAFRIIIARMSTPTARIATRLFAGMLAVTVVAGPTARRSSTSPAPVDAALSQATGVVPAPAAKLESWSELIPSRADQKEPIFVVDAAAGFQITIGS